MTLTVIDPTGSFTCKKCKLTFEATYKPQQRPRKSCPKCHKMVGMTVKKSSKTNFNKKTDTETEGNNPPLPLIKRTLTKEYIEQLICDGLESNPGNANLIGKAVEFYIKIKGNTTTIEDDIDMEVLKEIGLNLSISD